MKLTIAAGQNLQNIFDIRLQGGRGGNGGRAGDGGDAGVRVYEDKDGRKFEKRGCDGRRGLDGIAGSDGNYGNIMFVELSLEKMFSASQTVKNLHELRKTED